MSALLYLLLLFAPSAHAGPHAQDVRDDALLPLDDGRLRPDMRLALATDVPSVLGSWREELGEWTARSLIEGDEERLACVRSHDAELLALLIASEDAARELRPSVMSGDQARAQRETRRLQVALERGQRSHDDAARCGVSAPDTVEGVEIFEKGPGSPTSDTAAPPERLSTGDW